MRDVQFCCNIKGSLALSLEDTNGRMTQLGRQELTGVEHLSVDETVALIDDALAGKLLDS